MLEAAYTCFVNDLGGAALDSATNKITTMGPGTSSMSTKWKPFPELPPTLPSTSTEDCHGSTWSKHEWQSQVSSFTSLGMP